MNNFLKVSANLARRWRLEAYAAVLAVTVGATAFGLLHTAPEGRAIWMVAALAVVAAVAERGTIKLGTNLEESISLLPTLFAAVLFGPLAALVVGAASMLGDIGAQHPRPLLRWSIYTSTRGITGALTGLAATTAMSFASNPFAEMALATLVGVVVAETTDLLLAALTYWIRGGNDVRQTVRTHVPVALACVPLYAPLVALLALVYEEVSAYALPLFLVPAVAAQRLYTLYEEQRQLSSDLTEANERLIRANLSFATALVSTLDARDRYTAGHSAAVAVYARDIAARMGLSSDEQRLAHVCGLVHDIGKIGLAAGLLEKPGPLTLEERRQMETHSAIGERILANVDDYADVARIVRHHHERVDGHGYPDGLAGERIPLLSRIIAVADAYNAMTSDRPYRDAMPSRVARLRLAQAVESQFDTSVVAAFEALLAGSSEAYREGSHADFALEVERSEATVARRPALSAAG